MKKISLEHIKLIRSLRDKNSRRAKKLFWVEGRRNIRSIIQSALSPRLVVISDEKLAEIVPEENREILYKISKKDSGRIKSTKNFPGIGAIFPIFPHRPISERVVLALDKINDPGNLGTLLRTALWFGVKDIIIDESSCDPFNEKVIRSSMGAIAALNILITTDLTESLKEMSNEYSVICADMKGSDAGEMIPGKKIIVMGNEAHGLSPEIKTICTESLHIPGSQYQESLNVAVAAGIILYTQTKGCLCS